MFIIKIKCLQIGIIMLIKGYHWIDININPFNDIREYNFTINQFNDIP